MRGAGFNPVGESHSQPFDSAFVTVPFLPYLAPCLLFCGHGRELTRKHVRPPFRGDRCVDIAARALSVDAQDDTRTRDYHLSFDP